MNYRDAMEKVIEIQLQTWGGFFRDLPDLKHLPQQQVESILLERGREMRGLFNQVGFAEIVRFCQEFDMICLLYIICLWGAKSEDVPITDDDLENVREAVSSLCVAGFAEEGKGVINTVLRLLEEGLKTRQLPESANLLLTIATNTQDKSPRP